MKNINSLMLQPVFSKVTLKISCGENGLFTGRIIADGQELAVSTNDASLALTLANLERIAKEIMDRIE